MADRGLGARSATRLGWLRGLYPGYFALVMATGILSSALRDVEQPVLSGVLLLIAVVCGAVLAVALVLRVVLFSGDVAADLAAPDRAHGFFTVVASCGVLSTRIAADGALPAAAVLGAVGLLVWLGLSYGIPVRLILGSATPRPRPVLAGVNGTWFVWVVGTQALVVTIAALSPTVPGQERVAGLAAVAFWSVGVVLYLIVATLVLARLLLLEVRPEDLTPPYWVTMGATAITVLAAAQVLGMAGSPAIDAVRPVVTGLAVVLWAFGTWLIPMLVVFGLRRHVLRRTRFEYLPQLWSSVFPLGMYAVASIELGRVSALPIIDDIGRAWVWVALPVWVLAFAAMSCSLLRQVRAGLR